MIFRISILIAALGVLLSTQSACTSQKVPIPARAAATPGAAASSPALPGVVRRVYGPDEHGIACYARVEQEASGAQSFSGMRCLLVRTPRAEARLVGKKVIS